MRFDPFALWRGKKPAEVYAARDATLVEFSKTDGYKAMLDLYEREMRAVFLVFLTETDPAKVEAARSLGRAIFTLIRRVDEKAATIAHAETLEEFSKRMTEAMPLDRKELSDIDAALFEHRAGQAIDDIRHKAPTGPLSRAY